MIKFYLSPYSGSFNNQLQFIQENSWIYDIKNFYIDNNFFNDIIDLKYYPKLLKKKEDIDLIYLSNINNIIYQVDSLHKLMEIYCESNNFYIDFDSLINQLSPDIKHFVQLMNRYKFQFIEKNNDYYYLSYQTNKSTYCFYLTKNIKKKIKFHNNMKIVFQDNYHNNTISENGHLLYYIIK